MHRLSSWLRNRSKQTVQPEPEAQPEAQPEPAVQLPVCVNMSSSCGRRGHVILTPHIPEDQVAILSDKKYIITFTQISDSEISVIITINDDDDSSPRRRIIRDLAAQYEDLQKRLFMACSITSKFKHEIVQDTLFETAIEDKGINFVTATRDEMLLQREVNKFYDNMTAQYEASTDIYSGIMLAGTTHTHGDLILRAENLTVDAKLSESEWEHEVKIETKTLTLTYNGTSVIRKGCITQPGQRVMVIDGKKSILATVTEINPNDTYALRYDDGVHCGAVPSSKVQKIPIILPGLRITATWQGGDHLFAATIIHANSDGTYVIEYNDGARDNSFALKFGENCGLAEADITGPLFMSMLTRQWQFGIS